LDYGYNRQNGKYLHSYDTGFYEIIYRRCPNVNNDILPNDYASFSWRNCFNYFLYPISSSTKHKEDAYMNKLLFLVVVISVLIGFTYAYLPVGVSSTTYDASVNFIANASATSIENYTGVNMSCITPLTSSFDLTPTNISTLWTGFFTINETGQWNCTATSYNDTDTESNSSIFAVICPVTKPVLISNICYAYITITVDTNLTYYDIGDNVTLWADLTNSSFISSVWIFSADNHTYPFIYSSIRNKWYIYYKVIQKQEILVVQSFSFDGNVTGIGEYVLTYNPITVTNSTFESLWKDLLYLGAGGAILLVVVLIIVFAGPMLLSLMFQNIKEK